MEPPRPNIQNYGIRRKQQDLTFKIQKNGRVRKTVNGTDPPWALERGDGSSIIKWTAECAGVHFQGSGGCRRTYTATTMRWGRIVVAVAATAAAASVQQSSQDGCLNWSLGARGTGEGAEGVGGGRDYGHSAQCPLNISCLARPWCDPTLPCLWSNTASSAWCGQSVLPPAPPPPPPPPSSDGPQPCGQRLCARQRHTMNKGSSPPRQQCKCLLGFQSLSVLV